MRDFQYYRFISPRPVGADAARLQFSRSDQKHVVASAVDVSDIESMRRAARDAMAAFGRVHILVNNAGGLGLVPGARQHPTPQSGRSRPARFGGPFRKEVDIGVKELFERDSLSPERAATFDLGYTGRDTAR